MLICCLSRLKSECPHGEKKAASTAFSGCTSAPRGEGKSFKGGKRSCSDYRTVQSCLGKRKCMPPFAYCFL